MIGDRRWLVVAIALAASIHALPAWATAQGDTPAEGPCINEGVGNIDVVLALDDTGSFANEGPKMQAVFADVVSDVQQALPDADFAFGMTRFEEFAGFASEYQDGRPFILNEPVTTDIAALTDAMDDTTPGYGGDGPETTIEALWQIATGDGFDGNGDGDTTDSGPAGDPGDGSAGSGYLTPGNSGDVPQGVPVGGVGWRTDARRMVLVATDIQTVAPFPPGAIPSTITGLDGQASVASSAFDAGSGRFGNVGGSVAPLGAATVQETIDALNAVDIQVLGVVPGGTPIQNPTGPTSSPSVLTSALALLTGAVDDQGAPLVFNLGSDSAALRQALVDAIVAGASIRLELHDAPAEAYIAKLDAEALGAGAQVEKVAQALAPDTPENATLALSQPLPGGYVLEVDLARSSANGTHDENGANANATSRLEGVRILDPLGVPVFEAETMVAHATSAADGDGAASSAAGTHILGASVLGTPIGINVPPNTAIPIPGLGNLTLNEQVLDQHDTSSALRVNLVHLEVDDGAGNSTDVVVGSAYAGAACGGRLADKPGPAGADPVSVDLPEPPEAPELPGAPDLGALFDLEHCLFEDDMEDGPGEWTHGGPGDEWELGTPTYGPLGAASGLNAWGTDLDDRYTSYSDMVLSSPMIDLGNVPNGVPVNLTFSMWYYSYYYYAGGVVQVDNGTTVTRIAPDLGPAYRPFTFTPGGPAWTGYHGGWHNVSMNLSDWAGDTFQVQFRLASNYPYALPGLFIDDVAVCLEIGEMLPVHPSAPPLPNLDPGALVGNLLANCVFSDDMESGPGGWAHAGSQDEWELGTPSHGPPAAASGDNVWGTDLDSTYNNNADAVLTSPPIDLTDVPSDAQVNLTFALWYSSENYYDGGVVEVDDGSSITRLAPAVGPTYDSTTWRPGGPAWSGPLGGWHDVTMDLSPWAGETVDLRFRMASDSSVTGSGFYLDDVAICHDGSTLPTLG